ncbi:MAG: ABC transporter substrate-binding protein [Gemmatimonadetes bacterium]|nr:ABC transporter substrate-binding protein [Gemmatimonadota bacterium]MXX73494.1 ABC transporter substrate-binding protein [Gemmatimonadota bacterium]MYC92064.1 ABC transporter substrate-binding protein [Gemmatimonadota bacterium]MYG34462.1 ABC transporter substrate-binding protein [Gemmatimonadota bacterium]
MRISDDVGLARAAEQFRLSAFVLSLGLGACGSGVPDDPGIVEGEVVETPFTQTFSVVERDGYRIVDIEASVVTWGGSAGGPPQRARLVLVPRSQEPPPLTGDLAGASLIRTPVRRIAVNDHPHEAMLRAIGVEDRIVAVGGHNSYDDDLRRMARAGEIQQIGYGWHMPPTLDALVAARPDVLIARMADLTHTQHMERVESLGIPVVPTFIDAEPHYMGRVAWVLLMGLLTGKEAEADAFVEMVAEEVDRLKSLAGTQPRRSVLWAWFRGGGNRWAVTQRNADAALIRDANAELVLGAEDDPELDTFSDLSTERLLRDATGADCWMIRDPLSPRFDDRDVMSRFKAYREGCVFWEPGRRHPMADTWEIWEMGEIRPDWRLADIVKMVHPGLRDGEWRYLARETWE